MLRIVNLNSFVSVVCPIRNEEDHIANCLESILNQDYDQDKFEILVVDGMSEDNTRSIIRKYQKSHDNVRLLDNPHRIVPTALNIGLKAAKGDIIIRVDGHAAIERDYFRQCLYYLKTTGADCVGGPITSTNETMVGKAIALAMSSSFGVGNSRFRVSGKAGYVDTVAFGAYRKEVFDRIGLFDEELVRNQDDEFNFRLGKLGRKVYFSPSIRSRYYPRSSLKKLWKQYFHYGFWKVRVLQKHAEMLGIRYFVPPSFLFSLCLSGVGVFFFNSMIWIFLLIMGSYLALSFFAASYITMNNGWRYFPLLPIVFGILHFSFGLGFMWGIIKFGHRWVEKKNR